MVENFALSVVRGLNHFALILKPNLRAVVVALLQVSEREEDMVALYLSTEHYIYIYIYTHTHTHIYIYIYIYISQKNPHPNKQKRFG